MTVAYYHGSPGSYKTSSMINDWYVPALSSGRPVLTNIRGIKPAANVTIVSSTDIVPSMFLVASGTLILIDELGECFRDIDFKKWRAPSSFLKSMENGVEIVLDALPTFFDKHRHFNLDIIGTAPGIKRVPADFMAVAEFGYKHKALKALGLGSLFLQAEHNGFDTGSSDKDFLAKRIKKIPKSVFDLYDSTTTGKVQGSAVSTPIYRHPVILGLGLLIAVFSYNIATKEGGTGVLSGKPTLLQDSTEGVKNENEVKADGVAVAKGVVVVNQEANALLRYISNPAVAVMGHMQLKGHDVFFIGDCDIQKTLDFPPGVRFVDGFSLIPGGLSYLGSAVPSSRSPCPAPDDQAVEPPSMLDAAATAAPSVMGLN